MPPRVLLDYDAFIVRILIMILASINIVALSIQDVLLPYAVITRLG